MLLSPGVVAVFLQVLELLFPYSPSDTMCHSNGSQVKPEKCDIHPDCVSIVCHTAAMPPGKPASWVNCERVKRKSGGHCLRKADHKVFQAFFRTTGFI